ncbi:helix-turn-helix domain-containing protein [Vallitaleaceae bacterium 9-2]
MKINSQQAKNVIRSLNDLIYDDIYVYDNKGALLATNREQADEELLSFGKIVAKRQVILVEDVKNLTAKAILFPVHIGNSLVAIVGLVGDYALISQYSALVVKIVEILLSESLYYQNKIKNAENNRLLVNELIHGKGNVETLTWIAEVIGKQINDFKYLALIDIGEEDKIQVTSELIIDSIEKNLQPKHLIAEYGKNIVILFATTKLDEVLNELSDVKKYLEKKYVNNISVGISDVINTYTECKRAFFQAKKTLALGKKKYKKGSFAFADYSLELLFSHVDDALIDSFIMEVFGGLSVEEIKDIEALLRVYIDFDTSLNATSRQLFIHKNTLQYRLNKIRELTGYNPRNTMDLYKLFTAINLFNKREEEVDSSF